MDATIDEPGQAAVPASGQGQALSRSRSGSIRFLSSLARHHPLRPLCWRWDLAHRLAEHTRRVRAHQADGWVRGAVRYLGKRDRARISGKLPRCERGDLSIQAAHNLLEIGGFERWRLEAWLLTGLAGEEVAANCNLAVPVVQAFEALFYDVRDHLPACDYIHGLAIGQRVGAAQPARLETICKTFAYHGGPLVLDVLFSGAIDCKGGLRETSKFDLNTVEGRLAMRARLAVMTQMLPVSDALTSELIRIRELISEIEFNRVPEPSLNMPSGLLEEVLTSAYQKQSSGQHEPELAHSNNELPAWLRRQADASQVGVNTENRKVA